MSTVDDDRIKPKYTKKAVPKKAPANKSILQEKATKKVTEFNRTKTKYIRTIVLFCASIYF